VLGKGRDTLAYRVLSSDITTMTLQPSLFVSHGAPTIYFESGPATHFLRTLGHQLAKPDAIIAVTAHWESDQVQLGGAGNPPMIYDFFGFPEELYRLSYPAPGSPALAEKALGLLKAAEVPASIDFDRGYDHGTWSPLMLMFPEAAIPVVQVSVQPGSDARHHLAVGAILGPLRADNVLILGSGGAVHNLRHFRPNSASVPQWASDFEQWLSDLAITGDRDAAANWEEQAPTPFLAHPRDEHFLPFLVAMGAGSGAGRLLHRGFEHGALSMAAFAFD
jgi:4,5-DOPA dioxygenase extradiol